MPCCAAYANARAWSRAGKPRSAPARSNATTPAVRYSAAARASSSDSVGDRVRIPHTISPTLVPVSASPRLIPASGASIACPSVSAGRWSSGEYRTSTYRTPPPDRPRPPAGPRRRSRTPPRGRAGPRDRGPGAPRRRARAHPAPRSPAARSRTRGSGRPLDGERAQDDGIGSGRRGTGDGLLSGDDERQEHVHSALKIAKRDWVTLPCSAVSKPASHRILVVDDEPDITALVAYHLAKEGYRGTTAASGRDALRAAREERPDLVVLDLMLPGASGYDVLADLRRRDETKELGVIVLTARKDESDRIKGLSLGADDYLPKPFSPQELVLRVAALLRRLAAPAGAAARPA